MGGGGGWGGAKLAAGWCGLSLIEASEAIDIRRETCGFGLSDL